MFRQFSHFIALMGTAAFLSLGHGALATLIIQQGAILSFSEGFLGLLTSASYAGFFAGSFIIRPLLRRVSYIRAYAVCAAMIAIVCLMLPIFPSQWGWLILRFFHGIFFSTAVIICEGWLNSKIDKKNRSRMFGSYMTVNYICYGISQYILTVGAQTPYLAYSLSAICLIMSLLPMCLTRFPEPQLPAVSKDGGGLSLRDAYRIAPTTFIGQFFIGVLTSASWLFVRYAEKSGFDSTDTALLAALFFSSGFAFQVPIGWLSDRSSDRRNVIISVYGISGLLAVLIFFGAYLPFGILAVLVFLFGGISATLFALNVAYGQDFVEKESAAEYSGRLFLSYAFGALIGPIVAGLVMDFFFPAWFFGFMAIILIVAGAFTFSDRFMPRFKPAKTERFQTLSPHLATHTMGEEDEVHGVVDIGPDLPLEHEMGEEEVHGVVDIGPDLPPEHEMGEEVHGVVDIGPDLPPEHEMGEEVHGVVDIGPDLPPEHEISSVYGIGDVGPDFPPEQLQIMEDKKDE